MTDANDSTQKQLERNKKETKKPDTTIGNHSMLGQCSENLITEACQNRNCKTKLIWQN